MHADIVAHIQVLMKFSSPSPHRFHNSLKEHQSQNNGPQNYLQNNCNYDIFGEPIFSLFLLKEQFT